MAMQPVRNKPDMAECCPVGPGGDTTIVNQDETMILDRTIMDAPNRSADAGWREDDSHVQGVYKTMSSDFGGS